MLQPSREKDFQLNVQLVFKSKCFTATSALGNVHFVLPIYLQIDVLIFKNISNGHTACLKYAGVGIDGNIFANRLLKCRIAPHLTKKWRNPGFWCKITFISWKQYDYTTHSQQLRADLGLGAVGYELAHHCHIIVLFGFIYSIHLYDPVLWLLWNINSQGVNVN